MRPVLALRASEVGPEVELNDLKACNQFDMMDKLHQIKLPTYVMCGNEDKMNPVKYSNYLTDKIENAQQSDIAGGSHFVQLEKFQRVNKKIECFIASLKD